MNWGLIITNLLLAGIVGVRFTGTIHQWSWWATLIGFWVVMGFRDYYLKGSL